MSWADALHPRNVDLVEVAAAGVGGAVGYCLGLGLLSKGAGIGARVLFAGIGNLFGGQAAALTKGTLREGLRWAGRQCPNPDPLAAARGEGFGDPFTMGFDFLAGSVVGYAAEGISQWASRAPKPHGYIVESLRPGGLVPANPYYDVTLPGEGDTFASAALGLLRGVSEYMLPDLTLQTVGEWVSGVIDGLRAAPTPP